MFGRGSRAPSYATSGEPRPSARARPVKHLEQQTDPIGPRARRNRATLRMTERACKAEEGRSVQSIRWISAATSQVDRPAAAVFVHGLGTTDLDLLPVAHAFAEQGIEGILLTLSGHDQSADDMPTATVAGWLDQVRGAVDTALALHQTTYLVGFSLGAALVLRVAAERNVAGVLCVSAFARPTKPMLLARAAVSMRQFPPVGSRRPRVSAKRTRADLRWAPKLPASIVASVLSEAPSLTVIPNDRRVLFIHSVDDPVADYAAVAELVQTTPSDRVRLISLSGLAHFIQFDIPPQALCRLAIAHFHPATQEPDRSHPIWVENVKQREEEVLRWSNVLTLLFFAVFTVFGTLAKATLPEVISKQRGAPYLLFAYALLIAGYLQIVFLYFFYMNRTQVYLRICRSRSAGRRGLDLLSDVALGIWASVTPDDAPRRIFGNTAAAAGGYVFGHLCLGDISHAPVPPDAWKHRSSTAGVAQLVLARSDNLHRHRAG